MIGDCSIVIRAYNEEKHIGRLLEGIKQQTFKDVEIILVDSGSTDSTVSIAQSYGVKVVTIRPEDFTFGRSLNYGVSAATREFVVIASAHVYPVYPDWIETLLRPFEDESVALTYGKQRGYEGSKYSEHQIFHQWFPDVSQLRQFTAFCNNANAAVRKSLWEKNHYDETLTGLEDLAWAKWAKEQGHAIAYVAEAEIIHVHNETPRGVLNRYRREAMAFKRIHPESHFNLYDFVRLTTTNIFSDLWHAAREHVLLKNLASIFWFRVMQFHGTRMGYRESSFVTPQLRETFYYARERKMKDERKRNVEPIRYNHPMTKLAPMTQTEYDAFLARSVPEYAAEHVRAGDWLESESLEKSRKEFDMLLPQGLKSEDNFLYTLHDGDDAVGMIWMKVKNQPLKSGFIYDVFIEERFRGKGHGKTLMLLLEEKARELELKSLDLHVFGSNHVARKLYETIGYEIKHVMMSKTL